MIAVEWPQIMMIILMAGCVALASKRDGDITTVKAGNVLFRTAIDLGILSYGGFWS